MRRRVFVALGMACVAACSGARGDSGAGSPTASASSSGATPTAEVKPDQDAPRGAKRDVADVAVSGLETCAVLTDGRVACMGPGVLHLATRPTIVPGVANAKALSVVGAQLYVAHEDGSTTLHEPGSMRPEHPLALARRVFLAGEEMFCSIRDDGALSCFKRNGGGGAMAVTSRAETLAVGRAHACAGLEDGTVRCIGSNDGGQLGVGRELVSASELVVAQRFRAIALSAGDAQSCAVAKDGAVHCWGAPDVIGHDPESGSKVPGVVGAVAISSGGSTTCVLDADGAATCWGSERPPTRVPGLERAVRIAAGPRSCAVTAGARLFCWGERVAYLPVRVAGLEGATAVSVGADRSCADTPEGARCWGELGAPASPSRPATRAVSREPAAVHRADGGAFTHVAAGAHELCGIDAGGRVECRRGDVVVAPGVEDAIDVSVGTYHSCAVRKSGEVACWGDNDFGQLGTSPCGSTHASKELVEILGDELKTCSRPYDVAGPVPGVTDAVGVAATGRATCALSRGGAVHCWGMGPTRGGPDVEGRPTWAPSTVDGVRDAVQISVGERHACARAKSGAVWCWGSDGHKPYNPRTGAVDPAPLAAVALPIDDAIDIAASEQRTCAVHATGTVSCWGFFTDDTTRGGVPEDVMGGYVFDVQNLRNAVRVGVGREHACAVTKRGAVYCWGHGELGQLGDGSGDGVAREVEIVVE